ncbi:MAG: TA system VapC family ribonuclease toxin [Pseudomonadota bacterium]
MSISQLTDINLLIYAHFPSYPEHEAAKAWLQGQLSAEGLAMPWAVALGFVRVCTQQKTPSVVQTLGAAWQRLDAMLDTRKVWLLEPGARHRQILSMLIPLAGRDQTDVSGDITDLHLVALAIEHQLTLCARDRGYARFASVGLRWQNPLI